jgi:hypothetical protein
MMIATYGGGRRWSLKNPNPRVRSPRRCLTSGSCPGVPSDPAKPVQIQGCPRHWPVDCNSPSATAAWSASTTVSTAWTYLVQNLKNRIDESSGKFFLHILTHRLLMILICYLWMPMNTQCDLSANDML